MLPEYPRKHIFPNRFETKRKLAGCLSWLAASKLFKLAHRSIDTILK